MRDLIFGMDVGENRHVQFPLHLGQNLQTFVDARAAKRAATGAVGLVKTAFENEGNAQRGGDFLQRARRVHLQLLRLNDAGACDEEKALLQANVKSAEFHQSTVFWLLLAT